MFKGKNLIAHINLFLTKILPGKWNYGFPHKCRDFYFGMHCWDAALYSAAVPSLNQPPLRTSNVKAHTLFSTKAMLGSPLSSHFSSSSHFSFHFSLFLHFCLLSSLPLWSQMTWMLKAEAALGDHQFNPFMLHMSNQGLENKKGSPTATAATCSGGRWLGPELVFP